MIIGSFTINKLSLAPRANTTSKTILKLLRVSNSTPPVFFMYPRLNERLIATIGDSISINSALDDTDLVKHIPKLVNEEPKQSKSMEVTTNGTPNEKKAKTKTKTTKKRKPKKSNSELPTVIGNLKYNDLRTYLDYAKNSGLSTKTTVFQGNLYEMTFLEFLRHNFNVSRLIHQGGKDDKGIDIRANWDPISNFNKLQIEDGKILQTVNSTKKVKPLALKKNVKNVKLFVQCKCWEKSRIDAKMIREVNGTFNNTTSPSGSSKAMTENFLMIVTPTGFTRQGLADFDKSLLPLVFIKYSKSRLKARAKNVYDVNNYNLGKFESFYCNPMANALLKGLDWTDFMKLLVTSQNTIQK